MNEKTLRDHLAWLLREGHAHVTFDEAIGDLPPAERGKRAPGTPHTPWRLLEHLRICQWDILEFSRRADHQSPNFPEGYWPEGDEPPTPAAWDTSVAKFRRDLQAMIDRVSDPKVDLFAPFPWAEANLLREALILADHNAYHLGQLVVVRRALGAWPER